MLIFEHASFHALLRYRGLGHLILFYKEFFKELSGIIGKLSYKELRLLGSHHTGWHISIRYSIKYRPIMSILAKLIYRYQ